MDKLKMLFFFGVFITVLPYLGFPLSFKNILITLSGIGVIYVYYGFSKEKIAEGEKETFSNFSESSPSSGKTEENISE